MGKLELRRSSADSLFSAAVAFVYNDKFVTRTPIIDSGSEKSSITIDTAESLGVNLADARLKPLMGVSGIKNAPVISGIQVLIPEEAKFVQLEDVQILEDVGRVQFKKVLGHRVPESVTRAAIPNILGLDFLIKLNSALVLSFKTSEFYIKW